MHGLIVDLFAGYGGASLGIRDVLGRDPDVAINHDATAVAMHAANHPDTKHLHGDVWHYAPRDVVQDRPVALLWASPSCVHFSQAKGGPLDRKEAVRVRALAWVVRRWARDVQPQFICVENVPQFEWWCPLGNNGRPNPKKRGSTFRAWVRDLEKLGYRVEWRTLKACDYGAPTSRNRLFIVARRDGLPIEWPEATHGPGLAPHRGACEVIDWSIPAPSIFGPRRKPLVEATLRRIVRGTRRFVLDTAEPWILQYNGTSVGEASADPLPTITTRHRFSLVTPYLVPASHGGDARVHGVEEPLRTITASSRSPFQLVVPSLIHVSNGERKGQAPRTYDIQEPLRTVVAGGIKHALVTAHVMKNFGGHESPGLAITSPLGTVTTRDHHALVVCSTIGDRRAQVSALLQRFEPSVSAKAQGDLFRGRTNDGVITALGGQYEIADIGMRLLVPRELARAHDFSDDLALERDVHGRKISLTKQVRLVGNSVARACAAAVLRPLFARGAAPRTAAA